MEPGGRFELPLELDAGFDVQAESQFNCARLINMYIVYDKYGKNTKARLRRFPGLNQAGTANISGPYRGEYVLSNNVTNLAYFVSGNKFYQMTTAGTITELGTLTTSTGYVGITSNQLEPFPQIMMVDGVKGYVWDGGAFAQITSSNFLAHPVDCDYLDGRIVVVDGESNIWTVSNINDAFTYGIFADARLNSSPGDNLVGVKVLHRRIYLFGLKSIESWYSAGTGVFPFRRDNNIALDYGAASTACIARGFDTLFFLANTDSGVGSMMRITGAIPESVSNEAFEYQLHQYQNPHDCSGYVLRTDDGHTQYALNFTADNTSWVYDEATGKILQREMLDGSRHVGQIHFYFGAKHYLGSYNSNVLYEEDDSFLTYAGSPIPYTWISPILSESQHRQFRIDSLELDVNRGIGLTSDMAPYDDPKVNLQVSWDGGQTYGNVIEADLTKIGDYIGRTRWLRLGTFNGSRDLVFKIKAVCKNRFGIFGGCVKGFVGSQ